MSSPRQGRVPEQMQVTLKAAIDAGVARVGLDSYGTPRLHFAGAGGKFVCGRYCSFADNITVFLGGYHRPEWVTTYPFPAFADRWPSASGIPNFSIARGHVVVENDVWVGSQAMLMNNIRIGNGAIVGARAVVSKSVPPYAIVAGNPARVVKYRFDDRTIADLLDLAWWNWPKERIERHMRHLLSGDVRGFIEAARAEKPVPGAPAPASRAME